MKIRKVRRSDEDVIMCGKLVAKGYTVMKIEAMTGIPHSTVHWSIMNRLPRLNKDLYDSCKTIFRLHRSKENIVNDWTEQSTKSN